MEFKAEDLALKINVGQNHVEFGFAGCGNDPSFIAEMRVCGPTNPDPPPPFRFTGLVESSENFERLKKALDDMLAHMKTIGGKPVAEEDKPR